MASHLLDFCLCDIPNHLAAYFPNPLGCALSKNNRIVNEKISRDNNWPSLLCKRPHYTIHRSSLEEIWPRVTQTRENWTAREDQSRQTFTLELCWLLPTDRSSLKFGRHLYILENRTLFQWIWRALCAKDYEIVWFSETIWTNSNAHRDFCFKLPQ